MSTATATRESVDHKGRPHWRYTYTVTMTDGSVVRCPGPIVRMTDREKRAYRTRPFAELARAMELRLRDERAQAEHDEIIKRSKT